MVGIREKVVVMGIVDRATAKPAMAPPSIVVLMACSAATRAPAVPGSMIVVLRWVRFLVGLCCVGLRLVWCSRSDTFSRDVTLVDYVL